MDLIRTAYSTALDAMKLIFAVLYGPYTLLQNSRFYIYLYNLKTLLSASDVSGRRVHMYSLFVVKADSVVKQMN